MHHNQSSAIIFACIYVIFLVRQISPFILVRCVCLEQDVEFYSQISFFSYL